MSGVSPLAQITVGVVVERRKAASQWIDFTWQPVTVLPGQPETAPWTVLSTEGDTVSFYAGSATISLYRGETGQYRDNLASGTPKVWVALRPTGVEPPYDLIAVTADPAEGEGLTQGMDDVVEPVPMPPMIVEFIDAFIAEHHVERPFYKRKRIKADPEALARGAPPHRDRDR
jgi:hypothetical protein